MKKQKDLNQFAKSLAEVRKLIQSKYPKIDLVRSPAGYYFFVSDHDHELEHRLDDAGRSVCVYSVKQMTLAQWLSEADELMARVAAIEPLPDPETVFRIKIV